MCVCYILVLFSVGYHKLCTYLERPHQPHHLKRGVGNKAGRESYPVRESGECNIYEHQKLFYTSFHACLALF